jgi:GntR family transcriptional regulator, transcriptional repressor for pyruvate dehydrogenase complex
MKPLTLKPLDTTERERTNAWLGTDRPEKIPEILARRILREITHRHMAPGDRLPSEADMLAEFGAGRASLREALRILEIHGVIRIKPGPHGGPRVTEVSRSDFGHTTTIYLQRMGATFHDLIEARLLTEPAMVRLAAQRLTDETAERIRATAALGWEALEAPPEDWSRATEEFHAVVASASGNPVLDLQASSLISIERKHAGPIFTERKDRERTLRIHDKLAEAILDRDADLAEELSRTHIEAVMKLLTDRLGRQYGETIEWR